MEKILFIWISEKTLDGFRLDCLKRAKKIYENVQLILITNLKKGCPEEVDTILPIDYYLGLLWKEYGIKTPDIITQTNFTRYYYLSKNPNTLYLDTDIYLQRKIEVNDYIGRYGKDISAVFNGNELSFFDNLIRLRNSNNSTENLKSFFPQDAIDLSRWMTHKTKTFKKD